MIYLYVKTHNVTGLKYLGKTSKDPYKYLGSGIYWLNHIKKYGNDISTEILLETNDEKEIKSKGIYYSELWDVKNSDNWANLTREEGTGGPINKGRRHTEESIQKMKNKHLGKTFTDEHKRNLSNANKGKRLVVQNHFFWKKITLKNQN